MCTESKYSQVKLDDRLHKNDILLKKTHSRRHSFHFYLTVVSNLISILIFAVTTIRLRPPIMRENFSQNRKWKQNKGVVLNLEKLWVN